MRVVLPYLSIGGMLGVLQLYVEYDYEGALPQSPELLRSNEACFGFGLSHAPFDDRSPSSRRFMILIFFASRTIASLRH